MVRNFQAKFLHCVQKKKCCKTSTNRSPDIMNVFRKVRLTSTVHYFQVYRVLFDATYSIKITMVANDDSDDVSFIDWSKFYVYIEEVNGRDEQVYTARDATEPCMLFVPLCWMTISTLALPTAINPTFLQSLLYQRTIQHMLSAHLYLTAPALAHIAFSYTPTLSLGCSVLTIDNML